MNLIKAPGDDRRRNEQYQSMTKRLCVIHPHSFVFHSKEDFSFSLIWKLTDVTLGRQNSCHNISISLLSKIVTHLPFLTFTFSSFQMLKDHFNLCTVAFTILYSSIVFLLVFLIIKLFDYAIFFVEYSWESNSSFLLGC